MATTDTPTWDPTSWLKQWSAAMQLAPNTLVQPILPGWTLNVNAFNSSAPQTEAEVVSKHSYGRQLGRISEAMAAQVQGFIGQEATHRRIHALFNAHLERQGHVNAWAERAARRLTRLEGLDARHWVAATAATEHITAIFAEWMLEHPECLAGAEPRLATLWTWHACEEAEHRSIAFDLYRALGGNEVWRARFMRVGAFYFLADVFRQTMRNLWHDGELFRLRSWRSGWQLLFASGGLMRSIYRPWKRYFAADFHPSQQDASLAERWLRENGSAYAVVGG